MAGTRLAMVIAREADVACDIDFADLRRATAAGLVVIGSDDTGYVHGLFDHRVRPLEERRVRQALNYAVNLEPLLQRFYEARARPLAGVCNGVWENRSLQPYNYNLSRAHALLESAGLVIREGAVFQGDEQLVLRIATTPPHVRIAQYVAREIERAGVTSSVTTVASSDLVAMLMASPTFGLIIDYIGGSATGVGELKWLDPRSRGDLAPGILLAEPAFQSALDRLAQMATIEELRARVGGLQKDVLDAAPWLFLYRLPRYTVHRPGIFGLAVLPGGELLIDQVRIGARAEPDA